ncbi:hypothetical protein ACFQ9X_47115 [Catenulispora yoronensis]
MGPAAVADAPVRMAEHRVEGGPGRSRSRTCAALFSGRATSRSRSRVGPGAIPSPARTTPAVFSSSAVTRATRITRPAWRAVVTGSDPACSSGTARS